MTMVYGFSVILILFAAATAFDILLGEIQFPEWEGIRGHVVRQTTTHTMPGTTPHRDNHTPKHSAPMAAKEVLQTMLALRFHGGDNQECGKESWDQKPPKSVTVIGGYADEKTVDFGPYMSWRG